MDIDLYVKLASAILKIPESKVTAAQRQEAKTFAYMYVYSSDIRKEFMRK